MRQRHHREGARTPAVVVVVVAPLRLRVAEAAARQLRGEEAKVVPLVALREGLRKAERKKGEVQEEGPT